MLKILKNIISGNGSLTDRLDRLGIVALEHGEFDISTVVIGMHYALSTGRLGTYQDRALRELSISELEGLIESLASKELASCDVPRFLNGRSIRL